MGEWLQNGRGGSGGGVSVRRQQAQSGPRGADADATRVVPVVYAPVVPRPARAGHIFT